MLNFNPKPKQAHIENQTTYFGFGLTYTSIGKQEKIRSARPKRIQDENLESPNARGNMVSSILKDKSRFLLVDTLYIKNSINLQTNTCYLLDHLNEANFVELDLNDICSNLVKLATTDGPTQAAINISRTQSEDPRIKGDFPIFLETKRIIEELNLSYLQDMGNLIVYNRVKRMDNDNIQDEIKKIPVCLGAHLDEITYLVSNSKSHGKRVLMPICAAPKRTDLLHPKCKIVGFRHEKNGEFCDIGTGSIEVEYVERSAKIPNFYDAGMDKKIPEGQVVYRQIIELSPNPRNAETGS